MQCEIERGIEKAQWRITAELEIGTKVAKRWRKDGVIYLNVLQYRSNNKRIISINMPFDITGSLDIRQENPIYVDEISYKYTCTARRKKISRVFIYSLNSLYTLLKEEKYLKQ